MTRDKMDKFFFNHKGIKGHASFVGKPDKKTVDALMNLAEVAHKITTKKIPMNRFEEYPHLDLLKKEAETVTPNSKEYWKLRCRYLEKTIDETYSTFERDTCRMLYMILVKREN